MADLHFVNKNVHSKSHSNSWNDRHEAFMINRYVQAQRQRQKLLNNPSSASKIVGWKRRPGATQATSKPSLAHGPVSGEQLPIPSEPNATEEQDAVRPICPPRLAIGNPVDPFTSTPWSIGPWEHNLLQYLEKVALPVRYDYSRLAGFPAPRGASARSHDVVQACLSAEFFKDCLFAFATSHIKHSRVHQQNQLLPRKDFPEHYTFKAVQTLRKHLSRNETSSVLILLGINSLAHTEAYAGNLRGARMYLELANYLIERSGGFSTFAWEMRAGWLQDDFHLSNLMGLPRIFARLDRDDPDPLSGPLKMGMSAAEISEKLELLDEPLRQLMLDLISFNQTLQSSTTSERELLALSDRRTRLIKRLLAVTSDPQFGLVPKYLMTRVLSIGVPDRGELYFADSRKITEELEES